MTGRDAQLSHGGATRFSQISAASYRLPLWAKTAGSLAALLTTHASRAQVAPVLELRWDAPPQCPTGDAVQDRIRTLVGGMVVRRDQLRAEGRIIQSGEKFHLTLIVRSGSAAGVRMLESDSCDHLTGAAAVGLGLLVRRARTATTPLTSDALGSPPSETGELSEGPPPTEISQGAPAPAATNMATRPTPRKSEAAGAPAGALPPPTSTPEVDTAESPRKLKVLLRAPSVEFGIGSLPGLSTGYALGAGAKYENWRAFVTGVYWPRHSVESQWPAFGVDVTRYAVEFDACRGWYSGSFEWAPCLHAGLTHLVAGGTGEGVLSVKSTTSVFSAGATLDTKLRLASWAALFLSVTGELHTSRPIFVNKEIGELYRSQVLGLKFGLGSEWLF